VFLDIKCGVFRSRNEGSELIVSPCMPFFKLVAKIHVFLLVNIMFCRCVSTLVGSKLDGALILVHATGVQGKGNALLAI
jgi:hypothetical protein